MTDQPSILTLARIAVAAWALVALIRVGRWLRSRASG